MHCVRVWSLSFSDRVVQLMVFGIVLEYAAGLSLSMMFWNLTYQYWVSAQTLLFFQHHFDRQQDVDDLKS
jgi:hypothetical protein